MKIIYNSIIVVIVCVFVYTFYFVVDYEQLFEAEPQPNEIWGDNPFGIDYKVVIDVKDGFVLYRYCDWGSRQFTLELQTFKRWYDKKE